MTRAKLTKILNALIAAAVITALCALGALDFVDGVLSDSLYQRPVAVDGQIVIVGMDDYALEVLGPMPWSRGVFADAINYLYSDPESAPAVIALDVLFNGEGIDPEGDVALVEACKMAGNVVVAASAEFGSEMVVDGDDFYLNTRAVLFWNQPFEELKAVTMQGCINAMADEDSYVRHVLYKVEVPDVGTVYSMPRMVYETYQNYIGEELTYPKTTENFFYLPFSGRSGSYYEDISLADLVNGDVDPSYFDGKIVLIGPYAAGMVDEYRTAIDHAASMYGIEVQANQIDAYRNGFYPVEAPKMLQLGVIFLICLILAYVLRDLPLKAAIPIWAGIVVVYLGLCLLLFKAGYVLHVAYLPIAVTAVFVYCTALNYRMARLEKKKVSETFGRYVDPAVINQLMKTDSSDLGLGGRSFDIAVLFVDIRGFTTMSESLDPATVVEILNSYLTLTTECIMRYHGTLDKFVGDCTMAFWNAPLPQEDSAYLACCAAMDMVEGAKELGKDLEKRFGRTIGFGVGVNFGPAVVGNIGAPQRMDYTAIGDTVNTAARLEGNAPAGTVYISRTVADALGDRAATTSLGGTIKLKGKAEGFEVLTLDSLKY